MYLPPSQYVDGVLTQDGDAFLYGANVVYKDLSTDIRNPTVDCYTAANIERELGLSRSDLISLALLVGCDYCPQGVPGVGRSGALKFIDSCKPRDSLVIMRGWSKKREGELGVTESKIKRCVCLVSFRNRVDLSMTFDPIPSCLSLQIVPRCVGVPQ